MPMKKDATRMMATMTDIAASLFLDISHRYLVSENILKMLEVRTMCSKNRTGNPVFIDLPRTDESCEGAIKGRTMRLGASPKQ